MKGLAFVKDPDGYLIEVLPQGEMITKPIDCAGVAVDGGSGCAQAGCQPGAPLLSSCVWDLPWLPESERAPACCLSRVYSGPCLLGSQIRTTANDRLINDRYDARLAVSLSVSRVSYHTADCAHALHLDLRMVLSCDVLGRFITVGRWSAKALTVLALHGPWTVRFTTVVAGEGHE